MLSSSKKTRPAVSGIINYLLSNSQVFSCAKNGHRFNSTSASASEPLTLQPNHVIFSGIQPTGIPHLGNYLGALNNWVKLQNEAPPGTKLLYSVADLHAITLPQDPQKLKQWKREAFATLLAIGLDPKKSILFYQSSVYAHSELMWILSCTASMGYLSRMTQWKSKMSLSQDASPLDTSTKAKLKLGLFSYPVLQAADILVHRATHVPVGGDQQQHLEFARECVTNFNYAYGPTLVQPDILLSPAKRVMSLQDPQLKMSKSHTNADSRILITDSDEIIRRKIKVAVTDSEYSISYDPARRPAVSNLLQLCSYVDQEGRSPEELAEACKDMLFRDFKPMLSEKIISRLAPIRQEFERVMREEGYLESVEREGAKKAKENAEETMVLVRKAVGL